MNELFEVEGYLDAREQGKNIFRKEAILSSEELRNSAYELLKAYSIEIGAEERQEDISEPENYEDFLNELNYLSGEGGLNID